MGRALLSALLLVLSYPPFDLGWAAWGALIPWLASLESCSGSRAVLRSTLAGLLFFGGTVWWVGHVSVPGTLLLVASLSLFFAAWGWLARRLILQGATLPFLLGLPSAWVLLEFLRSVLLSGFGWNLLAYSQWNRLAVIQIADCTGAWGVSFLIVLVNAALFLATRRGRDDLAPWWRKRAFPIAAAGGCLAATIGYGVWRLTQLPPATAVSAEPALKIAVTQGNIPQFQKWEAAFAEKIWLNYEELTTRAAEVEPDLIIWPETAAPAFLEDRGVTDRLAGAAAAAGAPLLVGAPTEDPASGRIFNSAVLLSPEGKLLGRYDKIHLVPFGEFIPLRPLFGWLKRIYPIADFSPGAERTVFHLAGNPELRFSVLICFEDLFPGLARSFVRQGAQALVVITNDAWFGRSAASLQHLQASVFRAVENRVWVVRAANTGWSGFVDPAGRRPPPPAQAPRFEAAVATASLPPGDLPQGPYTCWGELFLVACAGMAAWAFFPSRKRL